MKPLSILFGLTVISAWASPVPILVDSFSTNSFTGNSSAADTSIQVTNSSILNFEDQSSAGNASISLDNTSELFFSQTVASLYSGLLSGSGSVTKDGAGDLTMTGNNAGFSGPLFLQTGVLFLEGNYGGNVTVAPSATLYYGGNVAGDLDVNGGVITTQGISTLHVSGNYTQTSNATYLVNLSVTGGSTLIDIDQNATIAGDVLLDLSRGVLFNHTYTILHADGTLTGTYTLVGNYPTLGLFLTYDAHNVYLSFAQNFIAAAATPNQRHVSQQWDSLTNPDPDETLVLAALSTLSIAQTQNAFDQMSGEQYTSFILNALAGDARFTTRVYNAYRHLIDPCLEPCTGVETWISGGGAHAAQADNRGTYGFATKSYDVAIGAHTCIRENYLLGCALGYEADNIHSNLSGKAHVNSAQIALYSAYQNETLYLLSDLIGAKSWCDYRRPVAFSEINRKAEGKPQVDHGRFEMELGFNLGVCDYRLQPYVGAGVEAYHQNRIVEGGAQSLDLVVAATSKWLATNEIGCHFKVVNLKKVQAGLDLAWRHYYGEMRVTETMKFKEFGKQFPIRGPKRGHDGGVGGLFLFVPYGSFDFYLTANGELWRSWYSYEMNGGINYRW